MHHWFSLIEPIHCSYNRHDYRVFPRQRKTVRLSFLSLKVCQAMLSRRFQQQAGAEVVFSYENRQMRPEASTRLDRISIALKPYLQVSRREVLASSTAGQPGLGGNLQTIHGIELFM